MPAVPSRATTRDRRVAQQVERELLLLGAGPQTPRLDRAHQRHQAADRGGAPAPTGCRPRSTANWLTLQVARTPSRVEARPRSSRATPAGRRRTGGRSARPVDVQVHPAVGPAVVEAAPPALVLDGVEAHLGRLDAQGGVVGHHHGRAVRRWPRAAARMRLSALVGSSPLAATSSSISPLVSMRSVPPPGSWHRRGGCRRRWRCAAPRCVRITSRAARPTSSILVLCWSSSSTTISGITASASGKAKSDSGSEISTDVSSTTRVGVSTSERSGRDEAASRSVTRSPWGWLGGGVGRGARSRPRRACGRRGAVSTAAAQGCGGSQAPIGSPVDSSKRT